MAKAHASVSFTDLEVIRAAINSALHQNTVLDLAEQYRKLSNRSTPSAMTKALQQAYDRLEIYFEDEEEIEDE